MSSRLRTKGRIENQEVIVYSFTFTMPLGDWEEFRRQLEDARPQLNFPANAMAIEVAKELSERFGLDMNYRKPSVPLSEDLVDLDNA